MYRNSILLDYWILSFTLEKYFTISEYCSVRYTSRIYTCLCWNIQISFVWLRPSSPPSLYRVTNIIHVFKLNFHIFQVENYLVVVHKVRNEKLVVFRLSSKKSERKPIKKMLSVTLGKTPFPLKRDVLYGRPCIILIYFELPIMCSLCALLDSFSSDELKQAEYVSVAEDGF